MTADRSPLAAARSAHGRAHTFECAMCHLAVKRGVSDCPGCGSVVVARLAPLSGWPSPDASAVGIWRHASLLPDTSARLSLGEGRTPLVALSKRALGASDSTESRVFAKLEGANPTLSFKDRGMALAISTAVDRGVTEIVVASTGNAAVSASAYAAAAGLACRVFVGTESNAARKLDACRAYGARVTEVKGDYSAAYAAARSAEASAVMNVSTTYRNPIIAEGYRGLAAELIEDLGAAPAAVVVPIGAGPLLAGIAKGFDDMVAVGIVECAPRMIGVQAESISPIARAWALGRTREEWRRSLAEEVPWRPTTATAIADSLRGYEDHGLLTLQAIADSGGEAVAVSENEIAESEALLRAAGLWVEPSSAAAVAALARIETDADETIVVVLTAHGLKATQARPDA